MPYPIDQKLVIAVASSALFDLTAVTQFAADGQLYAHLAEPRLHGLLLRLLGSGPAREEAVG